VYVTTRFDPYAIALVDAFSLKKHPKEYNTKQGK